MSKVKKLDIDLSQPAVSDAIRVGVLSPDGNAATTWLHNIAAGRAYACIVHGGD